MSYLIIQFIVIITVTSDLILKFIAYKRSNYLSTNVSADVFVIIFPFYVSVLFPY